MRSDKERKEEGQLTSRTLLELKKEKKKEGKEIQRCVSARVSKKCGQGDGCGCRSSLDNPTESNTASRFW